MNKKKFLTLTTTGFALFAMFFGAGNLVIPPYIGLKMGAASGAAFVGFFLSGILIPFLAVLMVSSIGTSFTDLGKRFPAPFVNSLVVLIIVVFGPLVCVPRSGSTTYEVAIEPFFPMVGKVTFGVIFFTITLFLALSRSKLVDIIGRWLTPILFLSLIVLIVEGTINAPKGLTDNGLSFKEAFTFGFSKGYLTLDVLSGVIFSGLIISAIIQKGYSSERQKREITILSGMIAAGCLVFIYGGLLYLGATSDVVTTEEVKYIDILKHIAHKGLGNNGAIVISVAVAFACLTTAVAIVSAMGGIFETLSHGRIPYRWGVWGCTLVSFVLSIQSVDQIILYAGYILDFVYPITIALTLFILLFGKRVHKKTPYIIGVSFTAVFSAIFVIGNLMESQTLKGIQDSLPLAQYHIEWLLPAFAAFGVGAIINKK
ncbi:MAG: branched-chain amino acid transport system II carrier protein [Capnocytophaga gingivalis]|jgi:branched-chain amino acid transport system II carrier protein|uniref:branched-chain amino acid transport system II carrier protein n=1 Tax=Capnocytophaga gingivalis TaxID=1017 RepID=UPI0036224C24